MELINLDKNIGDILTKRFVVPMYQRNFAWGEEELAQMLQDIYECYTQSNENNYFIGSLVVLKRNNCDYEVIDGQQRLTAITLIAKLLNLNEAKEPCLFYDSRPEVETFFTNIYNNIDTDITPNHYTAHLYNAIDFIRNAKLSPDDPNSTDTILTIENIEGFKKYFASKVILILVEIPLDTDVANYFEIMNNRGEQLKKHEILKASLIEKIAGMGEDPIQKHDCANKRKVFAKIWNACSQMDTQIQSLFSKENREILFGEDYSGFNYEFKLEDFVNKVIPTSTNSPENTIDGIIADYKISLNSDNNEDNKDNEDNDDDDESSDKSIIDFPNFLMHVFKLYYNEVYQDSQPVKGAKTDIPLNENDLLNVFKKIKNELDPIKFIKHLLYCRTVFDRYIIKSSIDETDDDNYRWSLKKPNKYYYKNNTRLVYKNSFENQERLIKSLSMLQVSFRSKKYKNWMQNILQWFKEPKMFNVEVLEYQLKIDNLIISIFNENTKINFISLEKPLSMGVSTPHYLFNFFDYLYWVKSATSGKSAFNFNFKYRNSVEHHLPQSFKTDENEQLIDHFGNLCLISKSANSRMNNEDPSGKASVTGKYYKNDLPPKQKLMYDGTNENKNWLLNEITEHYNSTVTIINEREIILGVNN